MFVEKHFHPVLFNVGEPLYEDIEGFSVNDFLPSMSVVQDWFGDVLHGAHPVMEQLVVLPLQDVQLEVEEAPKGWCAELG